MKQYAIYDDSGRILQTGTAPDELVALQAAAGRNVLIAEGLHWDTHYVLDSTVAQRQPMPACVSRESVTADGLDEVIITGVPAGARIAVTGRVVIEGETDGAPIHLTFAFPGTYQVVASLFPYQDLKVSIHAV